jgi:hypothetical protein
VTALKRPLVITVLAGLGLLNGLATAALGVATIAGSRLVYAPLGYGPNRVPLASLLGPLSGEAGWILLALGLALFLLGVGLLRVRPWARLALLAVTATAALATSAAVIWGIVNGEWGVAGSGLLKLALYVGLGWYLTKAAVRAAFGRAPVVSAREIAV